MNCTYCEERMSDYLEGALSADERAIVDLHLQSCVACSKLRAGVADVMQWARAFPVHAAPEWLPGRIVANTPRVVRVTWGDWLAAAWRTVSEPRFAMALFTATLIFGWLGSSTGFAARAAALHPTAVYQGVEGWANRAYAEAVRNYYRSPIVIEIQCQIHRIGQLRESS
jgi:predicted anti-sigma-YlaC factor YlaD